MANIERELTKSYFNSRIQAHKLTGKNAKLIDFLKQYESKVLRKKMSHDEIIEKDFFYVFYVT